MRSSTYAKYVKLRIPADAFPAYSTFLIELWHMEQMKVLIVDDNEKVREVVRDYLPVEVDEIYECVDGGEALALYRQHLPDWVLMDWEMPKTDGITATRQIIAEFPEANICLVTAFDSEDLSAEAFRAGASGFVLKDNLFELAAILVSELEH
jgi:CheY-like chemotaxis protein